MHPILFELGPITIYSYGVLLAAAYLLGLWMAARRARQAGLDANKVLDLGIWVIIAALVGAKALLFVVDFEHFTSSWQEFTTLLRSGGVFYGGLIAAVARLHLPAAQAQAAAVDVGRSVRAGHRAGLHGRPARLPDGRLLLRQADRRAVGDHLHRSGREPERRHAAQRAAAPDAALRIAGRAGHPRRAARASSGAAARSRAARSGCSCCSIRSRASSSSSSAATIAGMVFGLLSTSQFISVVLAPLSLDHAVVSEPPGAAAGGRNAGAAAEAALRVKSSRSSGSLNRARSSSSSSRSTRACGSIAFLAERDRRAIRDRRSSG